MNKIDLFFDFKYLSPAGKKKRLQIRETDKLICNYMGRIHTIKREGNMCYPDIFTIVKYYISWDWLIPVFMKIKSDINKSSFSKIDQKNLNLLVKTCDEFITSNKIKNAYGVIIKMIKLINK